MGEGDLRGFRSPKWPHEITKPLKMAILWNWYPPNHTNMEYTWNLHPKITQKHKSESKMVAKWAQNHSKIDPKPLKNTEISENAKMPPRASPLMPERLEPIENGAKSQAKR